MGRRHRHFNPKAAGAALVLDARFITGTSYGAALSTWNARYGLSPTQTGTRRPTLNGPSSGINGNPAVLFDATQSQKMVFSGATYFKNITFGYIASVVIDLYPTGGVGAAPSAHNVFTISINGSFSSRAYLYTKTSTSIFGNNAASKRLDSDSTTAVGPFGSSASPEVLSATWNYGGNVLTAYQNGSASTTAAASSSGAGSTSNTDPSYVMVGGNGSGDGNNMEGKIGAIVLMESDKGAPVRRRIEHGLAFTYRIACK